MKDESYNLHRDKLAEGHLEIDELFSAAEYVGRIKDRLGSVEIDHMTLTSDE